MTARKAVQHEFQAFHTSSTKKHIFASACTGIFILVSCRTATIHLLWSLKPRFSNLTQHCPALCSATRISRRHSLQQLHARESTPSAPHPTPCSLGHPRHTAGPVPYQLRLGSLLSSPLMRRHSEYHILCCRYHVFYIIYPCTIHYWTFYDNDFTAPIGVGACGIYAVAYG